MDSTTMFDFSTTKSKAYRDPRNISALHRLSFSTPDLSTGLSNAVMDSSDSEEHLSSCSSEEKLILDSAKRRKRERKILQDALGKYDRGEELPYSTKHLVHKWKNKKHGKLNASKSPELRKKNAPLDTEKKLLKDLEESYKKLQIKEKERRQEVNTVNQKSKRGIRDMSSVEYKYFALKKKYDDLLQYMLKLESEKEVLAKENKALHSAYTEDGRNAHYTEQISCLEKEVAKMSSYIAECEAQCKVLQGLQEENIYLKAKNEKLKMESASIQESLEKAVQDKSLEKEVTLVRKLNETKIFFGKAIDGYKTELELSQQELKLLREQQSNIGKEYETNEIMLQENYSKQIEDLKACHRKQIVELKEKYLSKMQKMGDLDGRKHIIKLEKVIHERDEEIKSLKEQLKEIPTAAEPEECVENLVLGRLEEYLKQASSGLPSDDGAAFLESIKETINQCFLKLKAQDLFNKGEADARKIGGEIEKLQSDLREKAGELVAVKNQLMETKDALRNLQLRYDRLEEGKIIGRAGITEGLEALKEFPELLKSSEAKLSQTEDSLQKAIVENHLLTERLEICRGEVLLKNEQIAGLEERLSNLKECNGKLEREIEKGQSKLENLQRMVERKDEILEKSSSQLEERIRTCAALSSQIETLKENHSQEILALKSQSTTHDTQCHAKLIELQTENAKLESQLYDLKSDRANQERTLKRQVKSLEDQVDQLTYRNNTFQRQMETISSTYKSLFSEQQNLSFNARLNQNKSDFPSDEK